MCCALQTELFTMSFLLKVKQLRLRSTNPDKVKREHVQEKLPYEGQSGPISQWI